MHFSWWTLALQIVNFAILVWLLHRFLYRPVLRMIDARRQEIERRREEAEQMKAQAKSALATINAERAAIAAERAAALKTAEAEAEAAAEARRAKAEQAAAALLDGARKTVADERAAAVAEMQRGAVDLGVEIAQRLVGQIPVGLRAEAWLEDVERHLAGMPAAERSAMLDGLGRGEVEIVTANALPDSSRATWRDRLGRVLGNGATLRFSVDPELIAGVELHFPTAVLRRSWRHEIATLRSEIENHGRDR